MELIGRRNPARPVARDSEVLEIHDLSAFGRQFVAVVIVRRVRDIEHDLQHVRAEFLGYLPRVEMSRVPFVIAVLDDVMQDAADDRVVITVVARKYQSDVRQVRYVRYPRPLSEVDYRVESRVRKCVIDAIGVSAIFDVHGLDLQRRWGLFQTCRVAYAGDTWLACQTQQVLASRCHVPTCAYG